MIDRGKRSKTLSEVKQVKIMSKNLQSFLQISTVQKTKSFFHINCDTMHMTSRNLSNHRKITSHRETSRISWIIQVSLTESKNVRRVWFKEKKPLKRKLDGPFLWVRFNFLKAAATSRRQFIFYHQVPINSWHSFYQSQKDERLSRPWNHSLYLNTGPLDGI